MVGGLSASRGELEIGIYGFLVYITQRLLWPLTTLGNTLDEYQRSMASTNRVLDLIDTPITISSGAKNIHPKKVIGQVEFKDIIFHYKDTIFCYKSVDTLSIWFPWCVIITLL